MGETKNPVMSPRLGPGPVFGILISLLPSRIVPRRVAEGKRQDSVGQQEAFVVRKVQFSFASPGLKMSLLKTQGSFKEPV